MIVYRLLFFAFLSSAFLTLSAQTSFQKIIGGSGLDRANAIQPVSDGGYILAGETQSFGLDEKDCYLVKTDANGNVQWSLTVGGKEKENLNDVKQTPDGGFIAVGEKYQMSAKGELGMLIKTSADGKLQWKKIFLCRGNEAEGFSIQVTKDNGYIITGVMKTAHLVSNIFFPMSTEREHLYVLKTDASGKELWSGYIQSDAGDWGSKGRYVIETEDGYLIAGHIFKTAVTTTSRVCLLKLDKNGNHQWFRTIESESAQENEETASSVIHTKDKGFLVSGTTNNRGAGHADVFLMKLSSVGKIEWYKTYGGTAVDVAQSARELPGGGFVVAGATNSFGQGANDVYLQYTDDKGNIIWSKTFGGPRYDVSFDVAVKGAAITVSGFTLSFGSLGEIYVIRTDNKGTGTGCSESDAAVKVMTHQVWMNDVKGVQWKKLEGPDTSGQTVVEKELTPEITSHPASKQSVVCEKK